MNYKSFLFFSFASLAVADFQLQWYRDDHCTDWIDDKHYVTDSDFHIHDTVEKCYNYDFIHSGAHSFNLIGQGVGASCFFYTDTGCRGVASPQVVEGSSSHFGNSGCYNPLGVLFKSFDCQAFGTPV